MFYRYLDHKLHPKHKDHIVVLSSNVFPEETSMTYGYEQPIYDISYLHSMAEEEFKLALDEVENMAKPEGLVKNPVVIKFECKYYNNVLDNAFENIHREQVHHHSDKSDSEYEGGDGEDKKNEVSLKTNFIFDLITGKCLRNKILLDK